jgi:hypothetical protein
LVVDSMKAVSKGEGGDFGSFVRKYLVFEGLPCSRHCSEPTRFVTLLDNRNRAEFIGAYVCPDNYVSRIVAFDLGGGGIQSLKGYVRNELDGGDTYVREKDFRVATRHGWELGDGAEKEIRSIVNLSTNGIKEYYWTFYARSDEEKKIGNYLCEKCGKLFQQKLSSKNKLCSRH